MFQIQKFFADENGGTAIEYAMVLGVISIASIVAWGAMGGTLEGTYSGLSTSVDDAQGA